MNEAEKYLYIYVRVSTKDQKDKNYSIPRQIEQGEKIAKANGLEPIVYEEEGASASEENFNNRPVLFDLLQKVKLGEVKNMYVIDASRLSRNAITKAVISESLKKQGVKLYTFSKSFDFDKEEDLMTYRILEAIEAYETAIRKMRFQIGYISGNKEGRYLKPMPPYGYDKDEKSYLVVNEHEKDIFLQIVEKYIEEGLGTNQIADWLNNDLEEPTKSSKILKKGYITLHADKANRRRDKVKKENIWNPGTILSMLKNEIYYGKRKFKVSVDKDGNGIYEYYMMEEPFLTKERWDTIQAVRQSNAISKKKEDKYFYLLKGLLECGNCGDSMHGRIKENRSEYVYKCNSKRNTGSTCTSRGINIYKLNDIVWNAFKASQFYHKHINQGIIHSIEDKSAAQKRLDSYQKELKSIDKEIQEKVITIKELIKDKAAQKLNRDIYEETLGEENAELEKLKEERVICLKNVNAAKKNLMNAKAAKNEIEQGIKMFENAAEEFEALYPFETKEQQDKIRRILNDSIKNIIITYNTTKRKHTVEVEFNPLGVKSHFQAERPNKYIEVKPYVKEVGQYEEVERNSFVLTGVKLGNLDEDIIKEYGVSDVYGEASKRSIELRKKKQIPIVGDNLNAISINDLDKESKQHYLDNPKKVFAIELTIEGDVNFIEIINGKPKKINSNFLPPFNTMQLLKSYGAVF